MHIFAHACVCAFVCSGMTHAGGREGETDDKGVCSPRGWVQIPAPALPNYGTPPPPICPYMWPGELFWTTVWGEEGGFYL